MKKTISLFAAALILFFIPACKKDKAQSKTELLTSGSWKITAAVSDDDGNGSYETDDFAFFPPCFKDNFLSFSINGQVVQDEGLTKCDVTDPQTETSTWSFSNNEMNITIDADTYDLMELNNSTLKVKQNLSGGRSSVVTLTKR